MKGLSAEVIHQDLVATLGPEAVANSTVIWSLRASTFAHQKEGVDDHGDLTGTDPVNEAIMKPGGDNPFSFVPERTRLTWLSRFTVHRHLTESLGLAVRDVC
jgi:hypothetical protein